MAIFDISEAEKNSQNSEQSSSLFSCIAARLFFVLLFVADVLWFFYSSVIFAVSGIFSLVLGGRFPFLRKTAMKAWVSVKRSLVCALALLIALFSPAFGIMVACTYFLMYDKAGMEEVVPTSIQSQFKDLFRATSS
jgi:hypothetical protein